MNYFFSILALTLLLTTTQTVYADSEDRGVHCQPPSCMGLRGPFNTCAGKYVCAMKNDRHDRDELDPEYICLRSGTPNPDEVCCKDGKQIANCKRNVDTGEYIITVPEDDK